MEILLPVAGDDVSDYYHNVYHRLLKTKKPIMTSFNGVSAIFFIDDDFSAIKSEYLHEVEVADPSGYTTVKKFYDEAKGRNFKIRSKVERIKIIISNWEYSDSPQQIKRKIKKILEE